MVMVLMMVRGARGRVRRRHVVEAGGNDVLLALLLALLLLLLDGGGSARPLPVGDGLGAAGELVVLGNARAQLLGSGLDASNELLTTRDVADIVDAAGDGAPGRVGHAPLRDVAAVEAAEVEGGCGGGALGVAAAKTGRRGGGRARGRGPLLTLALALLLRLRGRRGLGRAGGRVRRLAAVARWLLRVPRTPRWLRTVVLWGEKH